MQITSMDIENKEFKRSVRGYNSDEVDEFLDQISEDYEVLFKENSILNEKVNILEEKIQHYKKVEDTIQNTLVLAQNAAEQAKLSANKEAELVIKNANDSAQRIIDKANNDVLKIDDEYEKTRQEFEKFRTKYKNFMNSQIDMFERLEKDFDKSYSIGNTIVDKLDESRIEAKEADFEETANKSNFDEEIIREDDISAIKTFFANK
jgi:cell division initiation protein